MLILNKEEITMIAYTIKVYLTDGDWGYVCPVGNGRWLLTYDVNDTVYFDTYNEARDYYYKKIKGSRANDTGAYVDSEKTCIIKVQGNCF